MLDILLDISIFVDKFYPGNTLSERYEVKTPLQINDEDRLHRKAKGSGCAVKIFLCTA